MEKAIMNVYNERYFTLDVPSASTCILNVLLTKHYEQKELIAQLRNLKTEIAGKGGTLKTRGVITKIKNLWDAYEADYRELQSKYEMMLNASKELDGTLVNVADSANNNTTLGNLEVVESEFHKLLWSANPVSQINTIVYEMTKIKNEMNDSLDGAIYSIK